jgi:hypothetical protein
VAQSYKQIPQGYKQQRDQQGNFKEKFIDHCVMTTANEIAMLRVQR